MSSEQTGWRSFRDKAADRFLTYMMPIRTVSGAAVGIGGAAVVASLPGVWDLVSKLIDAAWLEEFGRSAGLAGGGFASEPFWGGVVIIAIGVAGFVGGKLAERQPAAAEPAAHRGAEPEAREPTRARLYGSPILGTRIFVGRDRELAELAEKLKETNVRLCASIEGLAGIGKTELALQLVDRLSRDPDSPFPGGIYWLDAEDEDLSGAWEAIGEHIAGLEGASSAEKVRELIRRIEEPGEATLVVLDNVEEWQGDGPSPLPSGGHIQLLVTTRVRDLGGARLESLDLGTLDDPHDRELVVQLSGREEIEGLEDLLAFLEGHALALELAGVYLRRHKSRSAADYLSDLRRDGSVENAAAGRTRYERTVEQALRSVSEGLEAPVLAAWQLAACFEPVGVSVELSDAVGIGHELRGELSDWHLIEMADEGRWRMHRLVGEYGRTVGTTEARLEVESSFIEGCGKRSEQMDMITGFQVYVPDRAHLDRAMDLADRSGHSKFASLTDRVATARQSAGDFEDARALFQKVLDSDLASFGDEHPIVATRRCNLALVLQDLGDLAGAKNLLERALDSGLATSGEDDPRVATRRSNLALVLQDLGDLAGAKNLLEKALDSDLATRGENHPDVAISRSNLALVLRGLGDLPRAKKLLEKALDSHLATFGEDHPQVATARSNLALVLHSLGDDLPRAENLFEKALDSNLATFGEQHPSVAISRSNLAAVLHGLGDGERSIEQAREALRIVNGLPEGSNVRERITKVVARLLREN